MSSDNRVCVGVISSAHGVRGAFKLKAFTEDAMSLFDYESLTFEDGSPVSLRYLNQAAGVPVAKIESCTDRTQADALRGSKLYIPRDDLPQTDDDEFYIEDLVGLTVKRASDGKPVGTVRQVANYGAGDILEIQFQNGTEEMFSFDEKTFPEIEFENKAITFIAPEILEAKK